MELPLFNAEQQVMTYYYLPLSIFNLGCANHAHVRREDYKYPRVHMHYHVCHEGIKKVGANNVYSFIMNALHIMELNERINGDVEMS